MLPTTIPARCRGRAGTLKISPAAVSSTPWSTTISASNTSTRSPAICMNRKWPVSTSSPTVMRISTSDVGGQSWTDYPPRHMGGFDKHPKPTPAGKGGIAFPPGHILHDYLEARVMPGINGPVTRGELQYTAMWKVAQRMTKKPVKFGTISARGGRLRRSRYALQVGQGSHFGDRRRLECRAARSRRCRLPDGPIRGAADPHAGGAQDHRHADDPRVQRRDL